MRTPQKRLDVLTTKVDDASKVRLLKGHPGWEVVADMIREGIERRRDRILVSSCDFDEIKVHREVIMFMEQILRMPEVSDADLEKWRGAIAFLQNQENMRKSLSPTIQGDQT